jgi:WD40 repeat protein
MKRHAVISLLIASTILGSWFPFGAKAAEESKETKSSKSELKLLYELTLPECITAYSVKKGKDRKNEIDKILTITGVYEIDDKKQTKLIKKRTQELPEKTRCYPSSESFSPDGQYVVFCDELEERSKTFVIYDFKNNSSSQINAGLFGAFSNQSVMFHTDMYQTLITDFSGNKVSEHAGMLFIKGFKDGFVCKGDGPHFFFLNDQGQLHAKREHRSPGIAYDVDQGTGITAIVIPTESKMLIYDDCGNLKQDFILPELGYMAGIGLSEGGDYVVVVSGNGWIRFFDVNKKKEIWRKGFTWGDRFIGSNSPVPVSADGKYVIVYGDLDQKENPTWSLIILDQLGNNVALFDAPRDRGYMAYYHIDFIPETHRIVGFTDNTLSVYEIIERE